MSISSLNQFIDPDLSADDVLHTNGYGDVAGGGGAGGLSIEQRRNLNRKEARTVQDYKYSQLGRQGSAVKSRTANQSRARVYDASTGTFSDKAGYANRRNGSIGGRGQIDTASINRRQHFIEPQPRMHDPYA